jgi:hypothetical protein
MPNIYLTTYTDIWTVPKKWQILDVKRERVGVRMDDLGWRTKWAAAVDGTQEVGGSGSRQ